MAKKKRGSQDEPKPLVFSHLEKKQILYKNEDKKQSKGVRKAGFLCVFLKSNVTFQGAKHLCGHSKTEGVKKKKKHIREMPS